MGRIVLPSGSPEDWKRFLAQPDLHWATGYSARTLAHSWEASGDRAPVEVEALLTRALGPVKLLLAIPEHKTPLPGGERASQSDVFALIRYAEGLAACCIEGKVDEPFGPTLGEWSVDMSAGKRLRIDYILDMLGLTSCPAEIRYQLLHRTASALIEADRFAASTAAMLVHSFSPSHRRFDEFGRLLALFGQTAKMGEPVVVTTRSRRRLVLGWCCGDPRYLLA